jgi:hypothetical protein
MTSTAAMKRVLFAGTAALAVFTLSLAQARPLPPSPEWAQAMPSGPVAGTKITEEYAKLVARNAYFWAWPLVNVYNRRLAFEKVPEIVLSGPVPAAPLNHLGMLTDYIVPEERVAACPNQDVVYGIGSLALDVSPVVIQVPDFGDRFWVYQIVDLRTDSFADLGKMYGTTPARYAEVRAVLAVAEQDPNTKAAMTEAAVEADKELVKPVFEFRNWGLQLPHNWSTQSNGAAFGTDYFTRTAVAKSNISVNKPNETKYFYQDLDDAGQRLNGANRYGHVRSNATHSWLLVAHSLPRVPFLCAQ